METGTGCKRCPNADDDLIVIHSTTQLRCLKCGHVYPMKNIEDVSIAAQHLFSIEQSLQHLHCMN